jgi:type 1 glutamine amidotransferase
VKEVGPGQFIVRGDSEGEKAPLRRADVKKMSVSPLSIMPTGLAEGLGAEKMRHLLTFLLTEPIAPAPVQRKGAPPPRSRAEVEAVLKGSAPADISKPLRILLVAGPKDHGPSEHDYPDWQKRWTTLLGLAENVTVSQADEWPTAAQWAECDAAVFYNANPRWSEATAKDLDAHLARGGGAVFLHFAVHGRDAPEALAERIGLAWGKGSKFRHGELDLLIRDPAHPIMRGFEDVRFIDESYWNLTGDAGRIHRLADAVEEAEPRPMLWTHETGPGRVFVSILGHYSWTFDDPLFRVLVLRGICWSAGQDADRLNGLAVIGARMR